MFVEVWGMNHRSAPVSVREKVSVLPCNLERELLSIRDSCFVEENVIVSTCNRFEVYTAGSSNLKGDIPLYLAQRYGFSRDSIIDYLYHYRDEQAVRHLFRVVTSLDSLIVGEAQVFGQVRQAYQAASRVRCVGSVLDRLFCEAFSAARDARSRTDIGKGAISVSSISIRLAQRIFGSLAGRTVLIIGAGQNGETTVHHLKNRGLTSLIVANRTFSRACDLARVIGGTAIRFEELYRAMEKADLVISSTGSPHLVVHASKVEEVMQHRLLPLLFIDIAVPRDIDPGVSMIKNVFLYNIDDLDRMRETTLQERLSEALMAEQIIEEKVQSLMHLRKEMKVSVEPALI